MSNFHMSNVQCLMSDVSCPMPVVRSLMWDNRCAIYEERSETFDVGCLIYKFRYFMFADYFTYLMSNV